jgi:hypothetical protein
MAIIIDRNYNFLNKTSLKNIILSLSLSICIFNTYIIFNIKICSVYFNCDLVDESFRIPYIIITMIIIFEFIFSFKISNKIFDSIFFSLKK